MRHGFGHISRLPLFLLSLSLIWSCASQQKPQAAPASETAALENRLADADALVKKGCYVDFKKAIRIYEDLYPQRALKQRVAAPLVKALLLMSIREKELGILNTAYTQRAADLAAQDRDLQVFLPYIELAQAMYAKTRGILKDIDVMATVQTVKAFLTDTKISAAMKLRAETDAYFAYLYVTFGLEFSRFISQKQELGGYASRFPDSFLLKYEAATASREKSRDKLLALLKDEPDCCEAYYYLGELALGIDRPLEMEDRPTDLIEAEKDFLRAREGIPESPQVTIYLGGIYLATEEYDKSLEYFERTLALAPTYRDAMLGKAIGLSYTGKRDEAIEILDKLVAMGIYLMGESHYWLAWNYHEREDLEKARFHIDESKARLPTDSEVFCLSGTIALEKGELDKADKEFVASLEHNPQNVKAILGLGRVLALKEKWVESAGFYAAAAGVAGQQAAAIADKIRIVEGSSLASQRKAGIVARKKRQQIALEETQALAWYQAAVGYEHAGSRDQALALAAKAAGHPQYKQAAENLIKLIKLRRPG